MTAGTPNEKNPTDCYGRAPGTTNTQIVGQVLSTGNSSPVEKTRANLAAQLALTGGYALLDRFARQVGAR